MTEYQIRSTPKGKPLVRLMTRAHNLSTSRLLRRKFVEFVREMFSEENEPLKAVTFTSDAGSTEDVEKVAFWMLEGRDILATCPGISSKFHIAQTKAD